MFSGWSDKKGAKDFDTSSYSSSERDKEEEIKIQSFNFYQDKTDCKVTKSFDAMIGCWGLVSQVKSYYRYGEQNPCTQQWEDLKFCFKVKTRPDKVRKQLVQEREREKAECKYRGKNSLDIWELREQPPPNFPPVSGWETLDDSSIGYNE
ncbi:hypothetical protein G9A89_004349 [Geosiphon pyriformis]|nr:hypothetical protein G9A89_004349 [Geosiphon pyriformis]